MHIRAKDPSYAPSVQPDLPARLLDDAALAGAIAAAAPRIDAAAEAEFCRRLGPRVRLYGLRHLRDRHAAADLEQQVLLMTLERLRAARIRRPEKLASYVFGMCRLVTREIRRGTARRDALLEAYGHHADVAEPPGPALIRGERLRACLDALAERERSVLVLGFFADKPADEIARELGLTPGNTRVIRHRAIVRLRECLGVRGAWP